MSAVLGAIAALAMLEELRNPKKAPSDYLSSAGGVYSWESSTEQQKDAGLCNLQSMMLLRALLEDSHNRSKVTVESVSQVQEPWNKHTETESFQEESKDALINEIQTNRLADFMSCQKR